MKRFRKSIVQSLLLTASCTLLHAGNLIPDPDFDAQNVSHWSPLDGGNSIAFDATLNITGNAGSGSAKITNVIGSGGGNTNSDLCLPGSYAAGAWVYGAWLYAPSTQDYLSTGVGLVFYASNDCSGSPIIGGEVSPTPTMFDAWQLSTQTLTLPSAANSADVYLNVRNGGTSIAINFDGVRFGPLGTTPVALQSFEVE